MPTHTRSDSTRFLGEVINEDRLCRKCSYSLKGLHAGGMCPECGTPIPRSKPRVLGGDNLSDAPVDYLRKLSFGLGLASIGLCLIVLGLLSIRGASDASGPIFFGAGAVLWIVGAAISSGKRPRSESTLGDACLDHEPWLLGIRLAQLVWLFPVLFAVWRLMIIKSGSTNGLDLALAGLNVSTVLAFVASVPVLAHHNALATWAGDGGLASRIHTAAWGIGICGIAGPLLFLGSDWFGPVKLPAAVIGAILLVIFAMSLIVAVISVLQVAMISFLAISSNAAAEARDARVAQKKVQEERERYEREQEALAHMPAPAANPPKKVDETPDEELDDIPPTYRVGGYRIEDTGDDSGIFELAPEDDG